MAVGKIVQIAGIGTLLVGIVMTVVIMILKEWVIATTTFEDGTECTIGELGLFEADYTPDCAQENGLALPGSATTSGTTEFFPLFPAQEEFGGVFQELFDVEEATIPEFTTCEAYIGEVLTAVTPEVSTFVLAGIDATFNESFTGVAGALPTLDDTVQDGVNDELNAAVDLLDERIFAALSTYVNAINSTVEAVNIETFDQIETILSVDANFQATIQGVAAAAVGTDGEDFFALIDAQCRLSPQSAANCHKKIFEDFLVARFDDGTKTIDSIVLDTTVLGSVFCGATGVAAETCVLADGPANTDSALDALAASPSNADVATLLAAADGILGGCSVNSITQNIAACITASQTIASFGVDATTNVWGTEFLPCTIIKSGVAAPLNATFVSTLDGVTCDFTAILNGQLASTKFQLENNLIPGAGIAVAEATVASLEAALPLIGICASNLLSSTVESCANLLTFGTVTAPVAPSPFPTFEILPNIEIPVYTGDDQLNVPALIGEVVTHPLCPALVGAYLTSDDVDATVAAAILTERANVEAELGFAANFTEARGAAPAGFLTLYPCTLTMAGLALQESDELTSRLAGSTLEACNSNSAGEPIIPRASCATITGGVGVIAVLQNFYENDTDFESAVEECLDDDEDARRIALAQSLVPAALGLECAALIVAIIGVATARKLLIIIAGVLSVGGMANTLSALLLVQGAPVYANVGEECGVEEVCYEAGLARLLGLVAIATPLFAGIFLITSTLCMAPKEEDTEKEMMMSKVDAI